MLPTSVAYHHQLASLRTRSVRVSVLSPLCWILAGLVLACSEPPTRPPLPPSASDLTLLKTGRLCDSKTGFLTKIRPEHVQTVAWGGGHELRVAAKHSASQAEESWYFDPEGTLVGALFIYPAGLPLGAYPVLRDTLSQLRPARDFYLHVAKLPTKDRMETSYLYQTGDVTTTTQYLTTGSKADPILILASFAIDPYVFLFSPYRKEFLDRLRGPESAKTSQGSVDQEPYPALLEFARGESALLAYCGIRNPTVATEAYQNSIEKGLSDKTRLAEAHHKLGLAWQASGQLEKAKAAMERSLDIRPNAPEVINNLGTTYLQLGDRAQAIAYFEKAVSLRPNYPLARFNLAEAVEPTNRKLAIAEYETYLALVEGNPDEVPRAAMVKRRVKALRH